MSQEKRSLSEQLVAAGVASDEQVARALAAENIVWALIAQGCEPASVLRVVGRAWGIPPAPLGLLATAKLARLDAEIGDELSDVPAVAITDSLGGLVVLVADDVGARAIADLPLPPHNVHLALETDILRLAGKLGLASPSVTRTHISAPPEPVTGLDGPHAWAPSGTEDSVIIDASHAHARVELTSVSTAAERIAADGAWGDLAQITLVEVVQILLSSGTDALVNLTLRDGTHGRVAVENKQIVFAEDDLYAGAEAFFRLAEEREGGFVLELAAAPPGHNVTGDTATLIARAVNIAANASVKNRVARPAARASSPALLDLRAPSAERVGKRVGDYEIIEDLGSGSTAVVMRARHLETGEIVALKVLSPDKATDPTFLQRFKREVRTHAILKHANILGVRDYGRVEGTYYLATETMENTLSSAVGSTPVPAAIVVRVLHDALRGLAFAHDRGVVHRDLGPDSIMLSAEGHAKIADFGLARYDFDPNKSTAGAIVGTPEYMSPEQTLGQQIDLRSDLFTLGSLGHGLLAGRPRFSGTTATAVMMAICNDDCVPLIEAAPTVPRRLEEVIHRLGAREHGDRYATAHDALGDLAPLAFAVNMRHPDVLKALLEDPRAEIARQFTDHAGLEARRGIALLARGRDDLWPQAALCALRARRLDGEERDGRRLLDDVRARATLVDGDVLDPALTELEQRLASGADDATELLRRMAKTARAGGDILHLAGYLVRLGHRVPDDARVRQQLAELFGDDPRAPFEWSVGDRLATRPASRADAPRAPTQPNAPARKRRASTSARAAWVATAVFFAVAIALVVIALLKPD